MIDNSPQLAVLGAAPTFKETLHIGRPNIGNRDVLLRRMNELLDRCWLSNDGPLLKEFERRIAEYVGVRHCIATCNATIALGIAIRSLELTGEVILPSYTFIATAHALQWQGIKPVFADMCPDSHNINPKSIEQLITPKTTGIIGVHIWGRPCDTEGIEALAQIHKLKVMYDAAHAFGCSQRGKMIGGFGACEVFSFHATKFINSFEGGAIVTNDDGIAQKARLMRNFGFADYDHVVSLGINGKMPEACAAMGLTSLEAIDELVEINRENHRHYLENLRGLPGISVSSYNSAEHNNYQYVVLEADPGLACLNRDELVSVLHAENVLARKYFWPGCHQMEPYRSTQPDTLLPQTERIAARIFLLPTGQTITPSIVETICGIIHRACANANLVRTTLALRKVEA